MMLASLISNRTVVGTLAYLQWPPVHTIQWPTLILTLCYIYIYIYIMHFLNTSKTYTTQMSTIHSISITILKTLTKPWKLLIYWVKIFRRWWRQHWCNFYDYPWFENQKSSRNKFYPEWAYYLRMIRILEKKEKEWNPRKRILAKAR